MSKTVLLSAAKITNEVLSSRIKRARYLLKNARHIAMATVNEDGSPHNTPLFFIRDDALDYVYWASHPDSLHCQNALRTGQVFFALYESDAGGGLFIKANESKELALQDLAAALSVHNAMRAKEGKEPLPLSHYSEESPQRMYRAKPTHFYVNYSQRNAEGLIVKDYRREISIEELMDNNDLV